MPTNIILQICALYHCRYVSIFYHYTYVPTYIISLEICAYLHYIITDKCLRTVYHYRYVPTFYHYTYMLIYIISLEICAYLHYIITDMWLPILYHHRYVSTYIISLEISLIASFMGPTWGRQDPGGPHVDPMNFAIWDVPACIISLQICAYLHCIITYMYLHYISIYMCLPTLYHYRCVYLHYSITDMCLPTLYHSRYVSIYIISVCQRQKFFLYTQQ